MNLISSASSQALNMKAYGLRQCMSKVDDGTDDLAR